MSNYPEIAHKKIVVERFGGPEELRYVAASLPAPPPGHARIKVLAIGVGHTDLVARTGEYILQRRTPFTPGYELIGEIIDWRGDGPDRLAPGTRVAASLPKMGAYTEYAVVPSWLLVPVPDDLDTNLAATLPLDYLTALSLLETHGRVTEGDTVLIHGATGGVGRAVSQLGRQKNLRMYGTASAAGSEEQLARQGVTFIDHRRQDFEAVIRDREPDGIDAVFDHIGGANLGKGHRLLARGGVLVSYAFMGRPGHMVADTVRGAARVMLMNLLPGRRAALCMVPKESKSDHDRYRTTLRRVLDLAATGEIEATVGALRPLSSAADVHTAIQRRELTGKVVLTTA